MARLNVTSTKSNLFMIKEQLAVAKTGRSLLDQKGEILVAELMRMVEKAALLEKEIDSFTHTAYPALRNMLMSMGGDRVERISHGVKYDFGFGASCFYRRNEFFSPLMWFCQDAVVPFCLWFPPRF